jgi:hypothetical protein
MNTVKETDIYNTCSLTREALSAICSHLDHSKGKLVLTGALQTSVEKH